jgi:hypothetical protein
MVEDRGNRDRAGLVYKEEIIHETKRDACERERVGNEVRSSGREIAVVEKEGVTSQE